MNKAEPITDMLFIDNSAGGGFSAIRAGKGPTFIISHNIAATIGKMHAKIQATTEVSPDVLIHGKAIFIKDLGALVLPAVDY